MIDDVTREEIHHRVVDLRFSSRSDGLYEVEGRLVDRKSHPFRRALAESETPPGTPLHDISVRLVLDDSLLVHDASARMTVTPFAVCQGATQTLAPLRGLRIGPGWNSRVRALLGGSASCTHIAEILGPMATTAIQAFAPQRQAFMNGPGGELQRRAKVDSCFAYAAHRDVVARLWPDLHRADPDADNQG
jgi:Protein of unknown function (DUF2889)